MPIKANKRWSSATALFLLLGDFTDDQVYSYYDENKSRIDSCERQPAESGGIVFAYFDIDAEVKVKWLCVSVKRI